MGGRPDESSAPVGSSARISFGVGDQRVRLPPAASRRRKPRRGYFCRSVSCRGSSRSAAAGLTYRRSACLRAPAAEKCCPAGKKVSSRLKSWENKAQVVPAECGEIAFADSPHRTAFQQHFAAQSACPTSQDVEQGRLAGTGLPHDRGEFSRLDGERDVGQGLHLVRRTGWYRFFLVPDFKGCARVPPLYSVAAPS